MGNTPDEHLLHALGVEALQTYFQPIINLKSGGVVGHEALMRGRTATDEIVPPVTLFAAARELGARVALERGARENSIRSFATEQGPGDSLLFLNFSSWMLDEQMLEPGLIAATCSTVGLDPRQVAIEIVEATVRDLEAIRLFAERNRAAGFVITLDDFGTEHSNLQRVPLVRPDVIKIDRSIVHGVADDVYQQSVLRSVVYLARVAGALALAEGVERYEDLVLCAQEGVDLAQGFLVGRPQPSVAQSYRVASSTLAEIMPRLQEDLTTELRREIEYQSDVHERIFRFLPRIRMTGADEVHREAILRELVCSDDGVECAYLVRADGVQMTETVFADGVMLLQDRVFFSPARPGDNHSLKEYIYGLVALGHSHFLTDRYVSMASGRSVRTFSTRIPAGPDGAILCVDLIAD